jgi:hypothetical protein
MRLLLIALIGMFAVSSCGPKITSGTSAGSGRYTEDLSVWRPEVDSKVDTAKSSTASAPQRNRDNRYVEARQAVTEQVHSILDSIYSENLSKGFVDGYTIQVYSGIKREDALEIKKKMTQSLPELESDVQYRQPNFRVRSGKYLTRLEAQKDYLAIKRIFPNAIVIPDRIEIQ